MLRFLTVFAAAGLIHGAGKQAILPPEIKLVGPYSPGMLAGDFLYVSGQAAKGSDGGFSSTVEEQTRRCLENVKLVVKAAGLTMDHVVFTQVYLTDMTGFAEMDRAWTAFFPKDPPARATIGIKRLPTETPVEINAVAVRDLSRKRVIGPGAVMAGERLYISGYTGRDPKTGEIPGDPAAQVELALDRVAQTLKSAGMDFRNMVFVSPYLTDKIKYDVMNRVYAKYFEFGNTPARATIEVSSLPYGANIEFTGVAVRDLSKRRAIRPKNMPPSPTASPCVLADDTLFCSAKSGFIPGPHNGIDASTVEHQVRQTMRNLLDGLEEAGMSFADVVATNVYLDDLEDFPKMNRVYAQYFTATPPARTTIQQLGPTERKPAEEDRWPTLEQISLIATRSSQ